MGRCPLHPCQRDFIPLDSHSRDGDMAYGFCSLRVAGSSFTLITTDGAAPCTPARGISSLWTPILAMGILPSVFVRCAWMGCFFMMKFVLILSLFLKHVSL